MAVAPTGPPEKEVGVDLIAGQSPNAVAAYTPLYGIGDLGVHGIMFPSVRAQTIFHAPSCGNTGTGIPGRVPQALWA